MLEANSYNVTVSLDGRPEIDVTSAEFSTFYAQETAAGTIISTCIEDLF